MRYRLKISIISFCWYWPLIWYVFCVRTTICCWVIVVKQPGTPQTYIAPRQPLDLQLRCHVQTVRLQKKITHFKSYLVFSSYLSFYLLLEITFDVICVLCAYNDSLLRYSDNKITNKHWPPCVRWDFLNFSLITKVKYLRYAHAISFIRFCWYLPLIWYLFCLHTTNRCWIIVETNTQTNYL